MNERYELAHLFKFISQEHNPHIVRKIPFESIKFKKYYADHHKAIDKLHFLLVKYNINTSDFLKYTLNATKIYSPELILNAELFRRYANHLERNKKYNEIHEKYMKTVNFIANLCVEKNITPKEYIRQLVLENRLAYEYISGRISKYFIASIQNFKDLYSFLDSLNKDELRIIYNAADELRVMVNEAFLFTEGKTITPLEAIKSAINKLNN